MDDNVPDLRRWNDLRACRNGRRLAVFTVQTGYSARVGEEETKQGEKRFLIPSIFYKEKKDLQGDTCWSHQWGHLGVFAAVEF